MQLSWYSCFLKDTWLWGKEERGTWETEGNWQSPGSPKAHCPPSQKSCSSWLCTASLSMQMCCWSSSEYAQPQAEDSGTGESHRKPAERKCAKFQDKKENAWNTKQQWIIYYQHHHSPRSADFSSTTAVKNSLKPIVAHFNPLLLHPLLSIALPSFSLSSFLSLYCSFSESLFFVEEPVPALTKWTLQKAGVFYLLLRGSAVELL